MPKRGAGEIEESDTCRGYLTWLTGLESPTGYVTPGRWDRANQRVGMDHALLEVGVKKTKELPRKPIKLVTAKIEFFEVIELANRWEYLSQFIRA